MYAGTKIGSRVKLSSTVLDFPSALRRNAKFFITSLLLFLVPGILSGIAAYVDEAYALALLSESALENLEDMHSKGPDGREAHLKFGMMGFYVLNNIGIAFRCFATGIFYGIGSALFIVYNGLNIGLAFGHLFRLGHGSNIVSFTLIHSPWELTAIVISGAAGLQMGYALVKAGHRTRLENLQLHGLELLRQIVGATLFLLLAAILEGWVSPSQLPFELRLFLSGIGTILVVYTLVLAGRKRPLPPDVITLRQKEVPR